MFFSCHHCSFLISHQVNNSKWVYLGVSLFKVNLQCTSVSMASGESGRGIECKVSYLLAISEPLQCRTIHCCCTDCDFERGAKKRKRDGHFLRNRPGIVPWKHEYSLQGIQQKGNKVLSHGVNRIFSRIVAHYFVVCRSIWLRGIRMLQGRGLVTWQNWVPVTLYTVYWVGGPLTWLCPGPCQCY